MNDEFELEYSEHCGALERDGRSIDIQIYRGVSPEEGAWVLEIVDGASGSSIVWDEDFEDDEAAYKFLMNEIQQHGLGKLIDDAPEAQLPT